MRKVTVTLTIGRNIGGTPMDDTNWRLAQFDLAVAAIVAGNGEVIFKGEGDGIWKGEVCEKAYCVIAFIEERRIPEVVQHLRWVARRHQQEACGMVVNENGTNSLVWAVPQEG